MFALYGQNISFASYNCYLYCLFLELFWKIKIHVPFCFEKCAHWKSNLSQRVIREWMTGKIYERPWKCGCQPESSKSLIVSFTPGIFWLRWQNTVSESNYWFSDFLHDISFFDKQYWCNNHYEINNRPVILLLFDAFMSLGSHLWFFCFLVFLHLASHISKLSV